MLRLRGQLGLRTSRPIRGHSSVFLSAPRPGVGDATCRTSAPIAWPGRPKSRADLYIANQVSAPRGRTEMAARRQTAGARVRARISPKPTLAAKAATGTLEMGACAAHASAALGCELRREILELTLRHLAQVCACCHSRMRRNAMYVSPKLNCLHRHYPRLHLTAYEISSPSQFDVITLARRCTGDRSLEPMSLACRHLAAMDLVPVGPRRPARFGRMPALMLHTRWARKHEPSSNVGPSRSSGENTQVLVSARWAGKEGCRNASPSGDADKLQAKAGTGGR